MHGVEAVRAAQEVGRALGRAADAGELDHALGLNAHLVHGVDDALGNGVVAAAGAERRLAALYSITVKPMRLVFGAGAGLSGVVVAIYFPSMVMSSSVTERASSGRP